MLPVDEITFKPNLSFLSQEDKEKIHQAILKILSEIGMRVNHAGAMALLADAGCAIQEDGMVKIPQELVLNSIESAPDNIAVYDREANHVMDLGGYRSYYGTGSDLIYSLEY
jgi:trimethylamine--corrinoid protein Co-methyltransferase